MSRKFKTADYEATLDLAVSLRDALPPNHLARFVVDIVAQLDLSSVYARYAPMGGEAFALDIRLTLLFYGYATGVFSSRRIERLLTSACRFASLPGTGIRIMTRSPIFAKIFWPRFKSCSPAPGCMWQVFKFSSWLRPPKC
jgi:hypothetical protein